MFVSDYTFSLTQYLEQSLLKRDARSESHSDNSEQIGCFALINAACGDDPKAPLSLPKLEYPLTPTVLSQVLCLSLTSASK